MDDGKLTRGGQFYKLIPHLGLFRNNFSQGSLFKCISPCMLAKHAWERHVAAISPLPFAKWHHPNSPVKVAIQVTTFVGQHAAGYVDSQGTGCVEDAGFATRASETGCWFRNSSQRNRCVHFTKAIDEIGSFKQQLRVILLCAFENFLNLENFLSLQLF